MSDEPLDDLLGALRDEWESETVELPPEDLEQCDAETRRSVEWLRVAWRLEAIEEQAADVLPPLAVARAAARRRRPVRRRVAASFLVAAAAAVALTVLLRGDSNGHGEPTDTPIATGAPADPPITDVETVDPDPPATEYRPEDFRSREDGVELVHGSVRIVLLTPTN